MYLEDHDLLKFISVGKNLGITNILEHINILNIPVENNKNNHNQVHRDEHVEKMSEIRHKSVRATLAKKKRRIFISSWTHGFFHTKCNAAKESGLG